LCCFASPSKKQQQARKQEAKKPRNHKAKRKNKVAHTKEGSSGRELGLVIFLWCVVSFLTLFRRCQAEIVNGCTVVT